MVMTTVEQVGDFFCVKFSGQLRGRFAEGTFTAEELDELIRAALRVKTQVAGLKASAGGSGPSRSPALGLEVATASAPGDRK